MSRPVNRPRIHESDDVICMGVPDEVDVNDPQSFLPKLERAAWTGVFAQYGFYARVVLSDQHIDWLITDDPAKVDEFQPAHDCEQCRQGNEKAREYLDKHPGATVAMGNIHFVEHWPEYELPDDLSNRDRMLVTALLDEEKRISVEGAVQLVKQAAEEATRTPKWTEM